MKLWTAQSISMVGSEVTALAIPLTAIVVLGASAFEVAALGACLFAPWLLFSLPAGAWVDRLPRRPLLVAADVGRAVTLLSIPLAYAFDAITIWQLYVVAFAIGTLTVVFDVAYQSYLPSLVARDELPEGNSKLEVSRSGASLGGPGIAGLLIELVTAPVAIVADAVSYLVSAVFVGAIRRSEQPRERTATTRLRAEIADGLRYVVRHPYLRPSMVYVAVFNFFAEILGAILLVYAVRELGLSAATLGVIFAVGNVGFLVGAFVAPRIASRLGVGPTLVSSAMLGGLAMFLVPLAPQSQPIPFLVAQGLLVGFAVVLYNVTGISLFQATTPDEMLGRMNASRRFVVWGVIPLGSLTGGALATVIGLRPTLFIGAAGASLAFLALAFSPLRSVRHVPDEPLPAAAA